MVCILAAVNLPAARLAADDLVALLVINRSKWTATRNTLVSIGLLSIWPVEALCVLLESVVSAVPVLLEVLAVTVSS